MHILEIPSFFPPYGGEFCLEQARALQALGHEVRVLSNVQLSIKRSISELEPLEIATVSQADTIAQKWKSGNGYKAPVFDASKMAESISKKWR